MVKKLTKHGNSLALIIDRPILELLKIGEDTPLDLTTDGEILIISPQRDRKRQKQLDETLAKINRKYGKMLKRLAD
jgi:antitoxin component of MazEF toxin-antitoxin module